MDNKPLISPPSEGHIVVRRVVTVAEDYIIPVHGDSIDSIRYAVLHGIEADYLHRVVSLDDDIVLVVDSNNESYAFDKCGEFRKTSDINHVSME